MAPTESSLPVTRSKRAACFIGADGSQVWPVRDASIEAALERNLARRGLSLRIVAAAEGELAARLDQTVVAIGREVEAWGRLYAHLTARRFRLENSVATLLGRGRPNVVVLLRSALSLELLEWLYEPGPVQNAPGIIVGDTEADLERQVLLRSASLRCPATLRPAYHICSAAAEQPANLPWVSIAPTAASEQVLSALSDASVLAVTGHSDGVDQQLPAGLILCPLKGRSNRPPSLRAPRCVATAYCHRLRKALSVALESPKLLSFENVQANVLILNNCFGVLSEVGAIDNSWSIALGFGALEGVDATLGTWGLTLTSPESVDVVMRSLLCGEACGVALSKFNASLTAREVGLKMCLFGDPDATAVSPETPTPKPATPRSARRERATDLDRAHALFLKALLDERRPNKDGAVAIAHSRATDALSVYLDAAACRVPVEASISGKPVDIETIGQRLRAAMIDYLLAVTPIMVSYWLKLAKNTSVSSCPCPSCGRRSIRNHFTVELPAAGGQIDRELSRCAHCGAVYDVPKSSGWGVTITRESAKGVALDANRFVLDPQSWAGGAQISSSLVLEGALVKRWPTPGQPGPLKPLVVEDPLPPGPPMAYIVCIERTQLTMITQGFTA